MCNFRWGEGVGGWGGMGGASILLGWFNDVLSSFMSGWCYGSVSAKYRDLNNVLILERIG